MKAVQLSPVTKMKKAIILQIFITTICLLFSAGTSEAETPKEVVAAFCKLDFEGNRLSSENYQRIKPLVAYPEEPGWDTLFGIHRYEIKEEKIENSSATVVVKYDIDRQWPKNYENKEQYQTETFHLEQENGKWKISEFIMYPRVSSDLLCSKLNLCETGSQSDDRTKETSANN